MEKIYYKKDTGYLCNRVPWDLQVENDDPYIEVDEETYNKTLGIGFGKTWAVINNELKEITMPGYERHVEKASLESNLAEYEGYLASTDYVVAKLTEFKLLDDKAFEEAKLKYSDIITARANAREKINEITEQLKDFADII